MCKYGTCPDELKGPHNKNKRGNYLRQRHKYKLDDDGHLLIKKDKLIKVPTPIENAPLLQQGELPKENIHYKLTNKLESFYYRVVKKVSYITIYQFML